MTTQEGYITHHGRRYRLDDLASALPDDERDAVHLVYAPCAPQVWWDAYAALYPQSADHAADVSPGEEAQP